MVVKKIAIIIGGDLYNNADQNFILTNYLCPAT